MFNGTTPLLAIAIAVTPACVACRPHNPLWPAEPVAAHASTRTTTSSDAFFRRFGIPAPRITIRS
jgi:hypothetical protein